MLYSLLRRRYLWRHLSRKFFRVWSFLFLGGESFASSSLPRRRRPFSPFSFFSLRGGFNTKRSLMQNLLLFLHLFFFRVGEGTFAFVVVVVVVVKSNVFLTIPSSSVLLFVDIVRGFIVSSFFFPCSRFSFISSSSFFSFSSR